MNGYRIEQYGSFVQLDANASEADIEKVKELIKEQAIQTMTEVIENNIEIIVKPYIVDYAEGYKDGTTVGWKCAAAVRGEVPDEVAAGGGFVYLEHRESWAVKEEDFKRLMPREDDEL